METVVLKSVADFKRALTVGKEITMVHHQKSAGRDEKGNLIFKDDEPVKRTVKSISSTQVCFITEKGKDSWLEFPKASKVKFEGNKVTILDEDFRINKNPPLIPLLTYIF